MSGRISVNRHGDSRATFYCYFRNRQHLFIQVANTVMNQMYEVAGKHYPNEDEYTRRCPGSAAERQRYPGRGIIDAPGDADAWLSSIGE